jgi:hypothetical protein
MYSVRLQRLEIRLLNQLPTRVSRVSLECNPVTSPLSSQPSLPSANVQKTLKVRFKHTECSHAVLVMTIFVFMRLVRLSFYVVAKLQFLFHVLQDCSEL